MNEEGKRYIGKETYNFEDLMGIMKILRSPDGCPWDREQTHKSIRQDLIEETYEAAEAIDNENGELLCEELGDVLMNIALHIGIAEENGEFSQTDVIGGICRKMLLRHPHVFGDVKVSDTQDVLANWEKIKTEEKREKSTSDKLDRITKAMPSLMRAQKIGNKSRKDGFDFACAEDARYKIREETDELFAEYEKGNADAAFEEAGDLLLACVNVIRLCGIDSERALYEACEKYIARYRSMEEYMKIDGKEMKNLTDDEKNNYWNRAKLRQNEQ